ncbi:MAG: GNAT family N-acetyltransferase [Acidocella sp.]|nr:GNAT family N-acetyltransferase [Acidocella sp.]
MTPLIRPAWVGEGQALYDVTAAAIRGLAAGHYAPAQIAAWMDGRDAAHYEEVIAGGNVRVAEAGGVILGFVDTAPGMVTRLFVRPEAAGAGLGRLLLEAGVAAARLDGLVRLEATLNAAPFYARCGFVELGRGLYTHPRGGLPVEVVNMELRLTP